MTISPYPRVLGLVADDLTGAADSAAGFAEQGWRVTLALRPDGLCVVGEASTVLAVSTGVRAADDDTAATTTARTVEAVLGAGAERLYLKIDSTVRGSVAAQIDGALGAWSRRFPRARAVICPAFPALHRTVRDGVVLVAGAPVGETAAATDAVTPRTQSDLATIVPRAVRAASPDLGAPGSRLVLDADTDADLDRYAADLTALGPEVIMVGSGGLAAALGRAWSQPVGRPPVADADGRVLLAVSSLHPVTATQLARLPAADHVDLVTATDRPVTAAEAATDLADRVAAALARNPYAGLVIVGGDGAAAILDRLGADSLEIDGVVIHGCPTGTLRGGRADGLRLVTKSGGFGDPDALTAILDQTTAGPRPAQKEPS